MSEKKILRPYQNKVVEKALNSVKSQLYKNPKSIASFQIVCPTGSGKTIMGLECINKIIKEIGIEENITWVAMRRTLLEQAHKMNSIQTQFKNISFVSVFDKNPKKCSILVFDESHHAAANSAINILEKCDPKVYIGMSATAERTDNQKVPFSDKIVEANYRTLIRDGYLSKFNCYTLPEKYTPQSVAYYYSQFKHIFGKSIAFFLRIEECEECARILRINGISVSVVNANSDVDEEIRKFRNGETEILLNVNMLVEGFDCEELQTAFVRDSSRNPTIQMAGRCLRIHESKKYANIVQSKYTDYPFDIIADPANKYILENGEWKNVGGKEGHLESIYFDTLKSMIEVNKHIKVNGYISSRKIDKKKKTII